jgi:hypothetical protein
MFYCQQVHPVDVNTVQVSTDQFRDLRHWIISDFGSWSRLASVRDRSSGVRNIVHAVYRGILCDYFSSGYIVSIAPVTE